MISVSFFVPFDTMTPEQRDMTLASALAKFEGRDLIPELFSEINVAVKEAFAQFLTPVIMVNQA